MATREIIDFIINLGGNVAQGANAAANAIDRLGASAKKAGQALANDLGKASKSLQQNSLISEFETLASLLTQVGGGVSQVGILASSAARPVAILGTVFGGISVATVGAAAGLGLLAAGVAGAISATGSWIEESATLRQQLISQRELTADNARNLDIYAAAVTKSEIESSKLRVSIADGLAPALQEITDAGTGATRILAALGLEAQTSNGSLSNLMMLAGGIMGWTPAGIALASWGGIIGSYADIGRGSGINYDQNYGPPLPTDYDNQLLERLRSFGAGPVFDPGATYAEEQAKKKAAIAAAAQREKSDIEAALAMDRAMSALHKEYIKGEEALLDLRNQAMRDLIDTTGKWQDQVRSIRTDMTLQTRSFSSNLVAQGMGSLTGGLGEVAGFLGSGLSAGGVMDPVTTAVVMGISMVGDIQETLEGLLTQVKDLYMDLPKIIGSLVGEFVPELIRAAPEIASAFLILGPAIALELVKVAPEFLEGLIKAVLDAPRVFANAILALPEAFAEAISNAIEKGINPINGSGSVEGRERRAAFIGAAVGGLLGGPVGGAVGAAGGLAIDRLAHGRTLGGKPKGGKASTARTRGGPSIGTMVVVAPNPREHIRQLRQLQGSYGYGYDLDPAAV